MLTIQIYRLVFCPALHCQREQYIYERKFAFKDIDKRLNEKHGDNFKKVQSTTSIVYHENMTCVMKLPANSFSENSTWLPRKLDFLNDVDLFFVGKVINNIYHCWIYIVGSPLEVKNYAYTMSFTTKQEKLIYYGHVKPLDESGDDIIARKSVLMIGSEIVKSSRDENMKISIEIKLHALKEEAKDKDDESGVEDDSD